MRKRPLFFKVLYLVSFTQYTRALTPEDWFQAVAKKLQAHILKSPSTVTLCIRIYQCNEFQNFSQGRAGSHVNVHVLREGVPLPIELRLVRHFKARRSGMQ
jgi:hypothetical protein